MEPGPYNLSIGQAGTYPKEVGYIKKINQVTSIEKKQLKKH